jgi:hypothetical protein
MINDTDDIDRMWRAMLDEPAPALPSAHDTLAVARRHTRRRNVLAVAGAGVASTVVLASIGAAAVLAGGDRAAPAPAEAVAAPPAATTAAPVPPPPLPPAPGPEAAHAHGKRSSEVLTAAAPANLTAVVDWMSAESPAATWHIESGPEYVSTVYVVLTTGQADGMVSVDIHGGLSGLGTDLCADAVTNLLAPAPPGCNIVTVNGVPIRVYSTHDERGDVNTAVRLLDGGLLMVRAQQGIEPYRQDGNVPPDGHVRPSDGKHGILGGWPALPAVPLTPPQVAALAADPALLP